jgi:flagella basal body P-ring formation protein FlgA
MGKNAENQRAQASTGANRASPKRWKAVRFLAVVTLVAVASTAGLGDHAALKAAETGIAWQSIDDIRRAAERLVSDLAGAGATIAPEAGYIDSRLMLADCEAALTTSLKSGSALSGRATVQVECEGERPWRIFVPVQVKVTDTVVVAAKTLASGHILTPDDVLVEARDVTRLRNGYIARPDELLGKRLKRQLVPGRVITPSMLDEQAMIRRGQTVTITADLGGISIETAGKALMDGVVNDRIEVENSGSGQVIEAIVRSPERVEVLVK